MMQHMRNPKTLKIGLWILLGLTIPSFVLFYGFSGSSQGNVDPFGNRTFVTVHTHDGKKDLGMQEIRDAQMNLASYYSQQMMGQVGMRDIENALRPREIADWAVNLTALDDISDEYGVAVSDQQVNEALEGVTREQLNDYLRAMRMSEAEFVRSQREAMKMDRAKKVIANSAHVSLLEAWLEFKQEKEKLSVEYIRVPATKFNRDVTVTDEEVAAYFEEHQDEYVKNAERVYQYLLKTPPSVSGAVNVSDEELQEEYQNIDPDNPRYQEKEGREVRQILLRVDTGEDAENVRASLAEIREKIVNGDNFARLANEFSEENRNIQGPGRGGILNKRLNDSNEEEFVADYGQQWVDSVKNLELGELSSVIEGPDNTFMLVKAERDYDSMLSFEDARGKLEADIKTRKLKERQAEVEDQVDQDELEVQKIVASHTSLEGMAETLGLDVMETSPTLKTNTVLPKIGNLTMHREFLMDLDEGDITPVLRTSDNNNLVVLKLVQDNPERPMELDEVRAQVEASVRHEKAAKLAKEAADKIAARVRANDTMTSAALDHGLQAQTTDEAFPRNSPPTDLRDARRLKVETFKGQIGEVFVLESGMGADNIDAYVIVKLLAKEIPTKAEFYQDLPMLEKQLTTKKQQVFIAEFQQDAIQNLKPEYDPSYVVPEDQKTKQN